MPLWTDEAVGSWRTFTGHKQNIGRCTYCTQKKNVSQSSCSLDGSQIGTHSSTGVHCARFQRTQQVMHRLSITCCRRLFLA